MNKIEPKQKAAELIEKFTPYVFVSEWNVTNEENTKEINENAKACAIIAIDEIIWILDKVGHDPNSQYIEEEAMSYYWDEVKAEINIL